MRDKSDEKIVTFGTLFSATYFRPLFDLVTLDRVLSCSCLTSPSKALSRCHCFAAVGSHLYEAVVNVTFRSLSDAGVTPVFYGMMMMMM